MSNEKSPGMLSGASDLNKYRIDQDGLFLIMGILYLEGGLYIEKVPATNLSRCVLWAVNPDHIVL